MKRLLVVCVALLACAPASAGATERAETYDAPGQSHAVVCARLAGSSAPLRFGDAAATGFDVLDSFAFDSGPCAPGTVRLDLHETLPSSSGPLAFHRGGNGYSDAENVKYGELAVSDLADPLPPPVPSSGGRGAACPLADEPPYRALVRSIPDEMHYKRPQDVAGGSNSGASFVHYGDPGADQGDRHDVHYGYLLWSFVNVRGGGMVRTLLAPGQVMQACDVAPVTMSSWDRAGGVNGQVTARYVRVFAGGCALYGWTVWSHAFGEEPVVAHAEEASGADVPAPSPDAACPVAAAAAAPAVATGNASTSPAVDGSFGLSGTVDPEGTPATYWFEYGGDTSYGGATAEVVTGSSSGVPLAVSAALSGLAPSTTYHYRLVATSVHGTTYGDDRTFATPAPPPVERPAAPSPAPLPSPPPVVKPTPPSLTHLRLKPARFNRARHRRGATTRIVYRVARARTVTLTFERKVRGRWVRARGQLVAGRNGTRFGGWLSGRPLAPGRYRVTASVVGGSVRRAGFTLTRR